MIIEVIRKIVKIEDDFLFGGFEMCVGEVVWIDEKKFSVLLDVINFVFEEIKVKVVGNELIVSVLYEFEIEGYYIF